ncbi:battenin-like isoform X2 [Macrobrachium nipponense]|uniref:battenin-like isoform X2 n=1 Tax=Macrobrachium nipponense TaxID=159736 RepID=UPI0030C8053B
MNQQTATPETCNELSIDVDVPPQSLHQPEKESNFDRAHLTTVHADECWRGEDAHITGTKESSEESSALLGTAETETKARIEKVTEDGGKAKGEDSDSEDSSTVYSIHYKSPVHGCFQRYRDSVAYWWLGFCNNFTYWVMITAAYDLLTPEYHQPGEGLLLTDVVRNVSEEVTSVWANESSPAEAENTFTCQEQSTGAILVADTLPATVITLASPLILLWEVNIRVALVTVLCAASYLILGLAHPRHVFLGVALASASRGFSDSAFLGHASHYPKQVLSTWSAGTGAATFLGPMLYSSLTTGGLDPRHALLIFLAIPVITAVSFWCLLGHYEKDVSGKETEDLGELEAAKSDQELEEKKSEMNRFKENILVFMKALKYIFPLSLFYFIMYLTNQGLLAILCIIGTEAYYHYLPSEYIVFTLLFIQGLLEGAAFRTTVFHIHSHTSDKERSFSLGVFPASLFPPALTAGFASMPVHNFFCKHHAFKM